MYLGGGGLVKKLEKEIPKRGDKRDSLNITCVENVKTTPLPFPFDRQGDWAHVVVDFLATEAYIN